MKSTIRTKTLQRTLRLCLGGTAVAAGASLGSMPALAQDAARMEKLEKENQDLKQRLEALEHVAQKEGILPSGGSPLKPVTATSGITLSGFVTASYFYDTSHPKDGQSDGYLWNTSHN